LAKAKERYATDPEYRERKLAKSFAAFAAKDAETRRKERAPRAKKRSEERAAAREARTQGVPCAFCGAVFRKDRPDYRRYCSAVCGEKANNKQTVARSVARYRADPEYRKRALQAKAEYHRRRFEREVRNGTYELWRENLRRHLNRWKNRKATSKLAAEIGTFLEEVKCQTS
jgi:endogenous inhibitor of DNA gyrase (YacG/DUF329 family)